MYTVYEPHHVHCMALQAVPSATFTSRGEISIQPAYFTSALFVNALREDIDVLITTYAQTYVFTGTSLPNPYASFKDLWRRQGWQWLHLKVLETRSRVTFLNTVIRLFLGKSFKLSVSCIAD